MVAQAFQPVPAQAEAYGYMKMVGVLTLHFLSLLSDTRPRFGPGAAK